MVQGRFDIFRWKERASSRFCVGSVLSLLSFLFLVLCHVDAAALTPNVARNNAIVWLESHQNLDGSWGTEPTKGLVTAEALHALARAGRGDTPVARKAKAWLINQEFSSVDFRARAVRALAAAGADVSVQKQALWDLSISFGNNRKGWRTYIAGLSVGMPASYDTALGLAALYSSPGLPAGVSATTPTVLQTVSSAKRADGGWSGDGIPSSTQEPSDLVVTAEILRAIAVVPDNTSTVDTSASLLLAAVSSETSSFELASRVAALFELKRNGFSTLNVVTHRDELLNNARFVGGVWSATDPFVNAMGVLAITLDPSVTFTDPAAVADLDNDGVPDSIDPDVDGDGVLDTADAFPLDPIEWRDFDGDGTGDSLDADDDGDGILDIDEIAQGTNPTDVDSDGDNVADAVDGICALIANGADADSDGICGVTSNPDSCAEVSVACDECNGDPSGWVNTDGDGLCNETDADDDNDGYSDAVEIAFGSDPLNANSFPDNIALTDPMGDFDDDGLTNADEANPSGFATDPYLADTDQDGATDYAEVVHAPQAPGTANNSAVSPPPVVAVFGSISSEDNGASPSDNAVSSASTGELWGTVTGGQATPVATLPGSLPAAGGGMENLAGFQPQAMLSFDADGDGLPGITEARLGLSLLNVDTDGDGWADGLSGVVSVRNGNDWDLDFDGKMDGEWSYGTDPANENEHPGSPGDVAPLGDPDGVVNAADGLVILRIVKDPMLILTIPDPGNGQRQTLTSEAADVDGDGNHQVDDALHVIDALQ